MESELRALAVKLFDINALKFGDFITKTGIKTPVYFDLRVIISYPKLMEHVATLLWSFSKELGEVSQICGIPYTALPIATLISTQSNVPMLIKRKEVKCYGTKKIVEGQFEEGQSCVIIEDIVTSGSSILETVSTLRGVGLKVSDAFVVIDREQGGRRNLEASGVRMRSLYTLTQILEYLEEAGKVPQNVVQGVLDYLKDNQVQLQESDITDNSKERTRMRFSARAKFAKNPAASRLLRLMESKQTTLCLAVDLTDSNSILELIELAGPHVAVIKTHVDIVEDFSQQFIDRLKLLADKHDFLIMEDRKFSDIGHTASLQYAKGIYGIAKWADFVTAHPVSGPGVLSGLREGCSDISEARGVFLVATMSSKGNLTSGDYVEKAVAMATSSDLVAGVVAQSNLIDSEPGLIQLTPGVQLTENADNLGQQYNTPESVVKAGADLVVVGRGITAAKDKLSAILKFKERLWTAYKCRLNA